MQWMSSLEWHFSATKLVGEQGGREREKERESNSKAGNHKTQVRTAVCFRGLLCSKYLSDCVLQHSFGRLRFKGLSNRRKPNQLFLCPSREHDSDSTFMDVKFCLHLLTVRYTLWTRFMSNHMFHLHIKIKHFRLDPFAGLMMLPETYIIKQEQNICNVWPNINGPQRIKHCINLPLFSPVMCGKRNLV